jgi:uracil-DNA glycosylase
MEILEYLDDGHVPVGWELVFEESYKGIKRACKDLRDDGIKYTPDKPRYVFRSFDALPPENVNVVIVGQDPYYTPGTSNGLAFSTRRGKPLTPTLKNIYKELVASIPGFVAPDHGDLSAWCRQGVLLLNKSLTAKVGKSGDHLGRWMDLISNVIKHLTNINKHIIWVMWGSKAQELAKLIGDKGIILMAAHPSPVNTGGGFLGCGHFRIINEKRVKLKKEPINWNLD